MPKVYSKRGGAIQPPSGAKYVGRPSKFGNRHPIGWCRICRKIHDRPSAIAAYRADVDANPELIRQIRQELVACDLVCWCAPEACHADVLLEVANRCE